MIKYSYKDKELKVPSGIGNNINEGFDEGFNLGFDEGFVLGYPSGVTDGFSMGYESGNTDGYNVGYPSGWTDGFGVGHESGVTDGIAEQKAKLTDAFFSGSGIYRREDGWSSVTIQIRNLATGDADMTSVIQTFDKNDIRPESPVGAVVYGGNIVEFEQYIDSKIMVQIKEWLNDEQTDYRLSAILRRTEDESGYEWLDYQAEPFIITAFQNIPSTWTAMNDSETLFARYDGFGLYIYWTFEHGGFFTDSRDRMVPDEDLFFSSSYDGISAITINAQDVYDSGYLSGHTDGYEEGYYDRGHTPSVSNFFSLGFILTYDPDYGLTKENIKTIELMENGEPVYPIYYEGQPMANFDINTTHSGNTTEIWLTGELGAFGELVCDGFQFELYNPVTNLGTGGKVWVNAVENSGIKTGGFKPSVNGIVNSDTTITIYV